MNAAKQALENSKGLFPQLDHQKRVIARSMRKQRVPVGGDDSKYRRNDRGNNSSDDESNKLPMQYRKRANIPSDDDSDEKNKKNDSDQSSVRVKSNASTSKLTPSAKKRNKRKRKRTLSASSPKIRVTPPNAPASSHKIEYYSSLSEDDVEQAWIKKSDIIQMEKDLCELDDGNSSNYATQLAAFMKVEGTEELSSDAESGEII